MMVNSLFSSCCCKSRRYSLRSLADSMKMEMLSEMDSGDSGAIEKHQPRHAAFRHNHNISRTRLYDPDLRLLCDAGDAGNFGSNGSNRPLLKIALGYGSGRVVSGFEFENNELILFSAGPVNKYSGFAGLVEIGRTIDNEYLDTIKERTGVELSVYMGNECVATTFMNETENNGADGAEKEEQQKNAQLGQPLITSRF